MDAIKLLGLSFLVLLSVFSCGGESQPSSQQPPSDQNRLGSSYSIDLAQEITSDATVFLTLNSSQANNTQNVTVESWSSSLNEPLDVVNTSEGIFNFTVPQVRKTTPFTITATLVDESGSKFTVSAQSLIVPSKPNLIVIFTDDQGYADVGAHNVVNDIETPNIDKLAANGVLFSNGYITAPQCTPSRAGMSTGM
jgi:hypothetical protein